MKGFINGYYQFSVWLLRFAYLNFLWVAFTLLGLILFGIFPATAAMFAVVRKWVLKHDDINIFQVFWQTYKKEFIQINLIGFVLAIIGYLLSIQFMILRGQASLQYVLASYSIIALFILYLIILMYFFPIYVHFALKNTDYIKWPFVIGIVHPILTIFLFIVLGLLNSVTYMYIPGLLFFFGGSGNAYILMWGAQKTFVNYESKFAYE
ncbi:YesL family protein [Bacillus kwashiorkori]|uniref:YesL family protein n=1 Tax=Bacillus kwashiorkori TaxID=1522318 RepID=UPI00078215F6|nr:DUF624 domain-containing protein [Bacillus kwashiorkori]